MKFSERQKLEKEYYKWLDQNKNVKHCPFSVITFLQINGNLISKEEHSQIEVIKKSFDLACEEIFYYRFPNFKEMNCSTRKFKYIKDRFKYRAKKYLGDKNE